MYKLYEYYLSENSAKQFEGLNNAINDNSPNLLKSIRLKKNTSTDTAISSRTLNYWTSIGLLDHKDNNWHRFSFVDIVFMIVVSKLRNFGLELEKIKKTKDSLYKPAVLTDIQGNTVFKAPFSVFEAAILFVYVLHNHGNIYLLIQDSGECVFLTNEGIELNKEKNNIPESYICLNLNKILSMNQIVANVLAKTQQHVFKHQLTENEIQIFDILQQDNIEQIHITKNAQFGTLKKIDIIKNITNLGYTPNVEFGEIQEQYSNGKITRRILKEHRKLN